MFRLCKAGKAFGIFAMAAMLLMCAEVRAEDASENVSVIIPPITSRTITGSSEPGEKSASDMAPICDEDEYVLLDVGNNYAEIYDSQGNYVSECRAYMDHVYEACIVKKDSVLAYNDGGTWCIFSMAELDNVLKIDGEKYSLQYSGNRFLVTDQYTGNFCLYDVHGNMLYSYSPEGEAEPLQNAETNGEEGGWQGRILALDHGYVIGACNFADDSSASAKGPVWVSKDGQESREITDTYLVSAFAEWSMQAFGDYFLIYDWLSDEGSVYDLDGNLLLEQIDAFFSPYSEYDWISMYSSDGSERVALVLQCEDGMCLAYNTQLQECAMLPEPESGVWDCGYASGFIKGVSYEQLEGNVCAGFVRYNTKIWCPYAETEDGWLVYADGELIAVPSEAGQDLISLNEAYVLMGYSQEDSYIERLIDRKTGETVLESFWDANGGISMELGADYCIVTEIKADGEENQTAFTIRDDQNQICCSAQKASARVWRNGYILLNRGIYHGIADRNGNWVVQTVYGWEE